MTFAAGNTTKSVDTLMEALLRILPGNVYPMTSNAPCALWERISFLKHKQHISLDHAEFL